MLCLRCLSPNGESVSLLVQDLDGHVLHDYRADVLLTPASVQKLITAAAAWLYLGKHWSFETRVWLPTHRLKDGVLDGDLIIEFQGAPDLKREELAALLTHAGVRQIKGNLLIYQSVFRLPTLLGWSWDNLVVCYVTAFSHCD